MEDNPIADVLRQVREGHKLERITMHINVEGNPFKQPAQFNTKIIVTVQPIYDAQSHTLTLADVRPISVPKGFQLSNLFGRNKSSGELEVILDLDEMGYPRPTV